MSEDDGTLRLHIEPSKPIEVKDLTDQLGSISRQYQELAQREGFSSRSEARLLVASVSRGSIDISLIPDLPTLAAAGMAVAPVVIEQFEAVKKLAGHIKWLLDVFLPEEKTGDAPATENVTVKDCDDAINIVKPIAEAGGSQTILAINGDVTLNILTTTATQARKIVQEASRKKAELQYPDADRRQRVSMVWHQLAKDAPVVDGKRSPDQGIITEIDKKPHAVFFTDEMAYLKGDMIDEEANPYKKVYFVDVDVSRVGARITAYRIVGYHGKDDLPDLLAEL